MNFIVCILALIIIFKGLSDFLDSILRWNLVKLTMPKFDKKVLGVVVEESELKNEGGESYWKDALIKYTREGETEVRYRKFDTASGNRYKEMACIHKGTLFDVWYMSNDKDNIFMTFHLSFYKMFFKCILPGILYITAGILGFCYVFNS